MRRLRTLLVGLTVLAVVLGTMGTALAASTPFKDVPADAAYKDAVARLAALKIVIGDQNGNFNPDNPITRAEFATIADRLSNLEAAAGAMAGQTRFSDVPPSHWAAGYVNAAASAGLLRGYPDGTFRPEAQVTQAEALTILVRALGYTDSVVKGEWPNNFLNQASALGITAGLNVSANLPATRAMIAQFANKVLETETLVQRGYGDLAFYEPSGKTFAEDKLGLKVWNKGEAYVTANARIKSSLDANEVEISLKTNDNDKKDDFRNIFGSTSKTLTVLSGIDTEALLGTEVEFWAKGNEIVYAKSTTDASNIKQGYLNYDGDGDPITSDKVWIDEDSYDLASDASIYVTDKSDTARSVSGSSKIDDIAGQGEDGQYWVRAVLNDDDEVVFLDVFNWEHVLVVTGVDTADNQIQGVDLKDGSTEVSVDLDDKAIAWGGAKISAKDIKEGDMVFTADDGAFVAVAGADRKVEGTLEGVATDKDGNAESVTIGDKEYDAVDSPRTARYSADENETVSVINEDALDAELGNLIGQDVVAYLDGAGKLFYLVGKEKVASGEKDGLIVAHDQTLSRHFFSIITEDGDLTDYEATKDTKYEAIDGFQVDEDTKWTGEVLGAFLADSAIIDSDATDNKGFALVKFTLTESGKLARVKVRGIVDENGAAGGYKNAFSGPRDLTNLSNSSRSMELDGVSKGVRKDALVFDLASGKLYRGSEFYSGYVMKDDAGNLLKGPVYWHEVATGLADVVVVAGAKVAYGVEGQETGVVVARNFKSSGDSVTLALLSGSKKDFAIDRDDLQDLRIGDIVKVDLDADGKKVVKFVKNEDAWNDKFGPSTLDDSGHDRDARSLSVSGSAYAVALDDADASLIVDASDDYSIVPFNSLVTSNGKLDPDYKTSDGNYRVTFYDTDTDNLYEIAVLEKPSAATSSTGNLAISVRDQDAGRGGIQLKAGDEVTVTVANTALKGKTANLSWELKDAAGVLTSGTANNVSFDSTGKGGFRFTVPAVASDGATLSVETTVGGTPYKGSLTVDVFVP